MFRQDRETSLRAVTTWESSEWNRVSVNLKNVCLEDWNNHNAVRLIGEAQCYHRFST